MFLNNETIMRHFILFITSFLLLFSMAQSQNFHSGLIAGATVTDVGKFDLTDRDNDFHKLGFSFGGLVSNKIGNSSFIQMEIAYIQKGSSQPVDSAYIPYILNLNYIDVSLILKQKIKFNIKKTPVDKFGVEIGITAGTPVKSSYTIYGVKQNIYDMNKLDLNLLAGIYYNFNPNFYISFRYSNSIIHAIKHNSKYINFYPFATWQNGNNLAFQITFGFVFNNGKNAGKNIAE